MVRIISIALVFCVGLTFSVWAQNTGTLEGQVTDAETTETLFGVNVLLQGTTLGAATESDGRYRISQITPGTYTVIARYLGYEEVEIEGVEIIAGETTDLNIQLQQTVFQADDLVVTGSRRPEKIVDAPMAIERVSADMLDMTGGGSYYAAIANLKGVNFVDAGINAQGISVRGFASHFNTRLLQMVDGRMAQLPGTGLPQGNFLPNTDLDLQSMELVLGPASALYGPNAHTGVLNVITKTPWDESGVGVSVRGGQQDLMEVSYRVAGTVNDNFGWKITGQNLRADDFEPNRNEIGHFYGTQDVFEADILDDYSIESDKIDGAIYYRISDWELRGSAGWSQNTNFGLTNNGRNHIRDWQVNYQQFQVSNPNWYAQITRTENDAGDTYQLNQVAAAVQGQLDAGVNFGNIELEPLREAFGFTDLAVLYDTELQYRNNFGGVELVTGVQYRNYQPNSEGTFLADAIGRGIDTEELGGYLQLDYRFLDDRLRLVGAARYDSHTNYESQFSPKGSLVYSVAPGHNVRVGYSRAFKSPTVLESNIYIPIPIPGLDFQYTLLSQGNIDGFELRDPGGNVLQTIDPLRPEEVESIEIGYKGVFKNQLFVDVVAYYSWYDGFISPLTTVADGIETVPFDSEGNQITTEGDAFTGLLTYFNFGDSEVRGLDIGLNYFFSDKFNTSVSASFIDRVSFDSENDQEFLLNVPETELKGSVTFTDTFIDNSFLNISSRWRSAYRFQSGYWNSDLHMDPQANPETQNEIPSRFVTDITAGYSLPNTGLSLKASVSNVFNTETVPVLGAPVRERLAWLSVTYNFSGLRF